MKDFDRLLNEQLEDLPMPTGEAQSKMNLIQELHRELENAKDRVSELERELRNATEDYNIELAKALRRKLPQLGINLNDGRCSASYRSTNLVNQICKIKHGFLILISMVVGFVVSMVRP